MVVVSADDGALATDVARTLAQMAREPGERVLLIAGEGPGLAEAIAGGTGPVVAGDLTEVPVGRVPLGRVEAATLGEALAAADTVIAAGGGAAGILALEPLAVPGRPVVFCANLRETRASDLKRLLSLAEDRGLPIAGVVVTGARHSAAEYYPYPTRGLSQR